MKIFARLGTFVALLVTTSAGAAEVCGHLKKIEILRPETGRVINITFDNGKTYTVGVASDLVSLVGTNIVVCGDASPDNYFKLTSIEAK